MSDYYGFAAAAFVRIILIWWMVRSWANTRYRTGEDVTETGEYETDPVVRNEKRARQRTRSVRFFFTWVVGAVIVWLSGLPMMMHQQPRFVVDYWIGFGFAVACVSVVFFVAEWAATGGLRIFLIITGWACAAVVSLMYCGAASAPSNVLQRIAQAVLINHRPWTLLLAYFVVWFPAGRLIGGFMDRWAGQLPPDQGLAGAGQWIGRLERFLIVSCLLAGQPAAIAVLVTAKGVLRFGEIKNDGDPDNQRRLVEYILVGSMMSYAVALSVGWIAIQFM